MKTKYLLLFVMVFLPMTMAIAQDDMYYKPKKQDKSVVPEPVVEDYVPKGIDMTVDEYNRRNLKSSYQLIGTDSLGNDIIEFTVGDGTYPENDTLRDRYGRINNYLLHNTSSYSDRDIPNMLHNRVHISRNTMGHKNHSSPNTMRCTTNP